MLPLKLVTPVALVRYPASLVKLDTSVGTVGTAPQSLINLPVAQSNTARCQFVLLAGHTTSPLPSPSAQSSTVKLELSQSVSVIVTVVVFHTLELVTLEIPLPVFPLGIVKLNTAALLVPELVTLALVPAAHVDVVPTAIVAAAQSLPSAQSLPATHSGIVKLNTAALDVPELVTVALEPGAPVVTVPTVIVAAVQGSPCSPFRLLYCAFLILFQSSLSENRM